MPSKDDAPDSQGGGMTAVEPCEGGGLCYLPAARDPIDDYQTLKCDIEGTVYARDDVAREGIAKILAILENKEG